METNPSTPGLPGRIVRERDPINLESPFSSLDGLITPTDRFYVRNHFPIPKLQAGTFRLIVEGSVAKRIELSLDDLQQLPTVTQIATMECAGNGRTFLSPAVRGAQWELGAVSTARWTGVRLKDVFQLAGVSPSAVDAVFEGADRGKAKEEPAPPGEISYSRSIPITKCDDVLLALAMNDQTLSPEHGFPLRAVVPGWFGMASVKWLTRILLLDHPFRGYFQTTDYAYWRDENGTQVRMPITQMQLKAQIARPAPYEVVPANSDYRIFGAAWTGGPPVAKVEISTDGGATFAAANLLGEATPHAWQLWDFNWHTPSSGETKLIARAIDADGHMQPLERDNHWGTYVICHALTIPVVVR